MKTPITIIILIVLLITACDEYQTEDRFGDRDRDGVPDEKDNCVNDFNPYQFDKDGDNKGYACDHNIFLRAGIFDPLSEEEKYIPNITVSEETGYYFIQLVDTFDYSTLDNLIFSINGQKMDAFEGDVYIIKTNTSLEKIKSIPGVRAAGIYQPANKIEPELFLNRYIYQNGTLIHPNEEITLEIYLYDNFDEVRKEVERLGAKILSESDDILVVQVSQSKLIDLIMIPDVNFVNPKPVLQYENSYAGMITGSKIINEDFSLMGEGEIITIADSGLDTGIIQTIHPDLRENVIKILDMETKTTKDLTGHGTHVASSAVGTGKSSNGLLKGSAPKAKIIFQAIGTELPEKASSTDPLSRQKGGTRPAPIYCFGKPQTDPIEKKIIKIPYSSMGLEGIPIDYTTLFLNSTIHSNSWGSCQGIYTPRIADIDKYLWNNKETVVIFSAGNDADFTFIENGKIMQRGGNSLSNTARAKNVITVGATETSRLISKKKKNPEKIASFSSKGEEISGRIKPDLVAPGTWILSARSKVCVDGVKIKEVSNDEIVESKIDFNHEKCIGKGLPSGQKENVKDDLYMFNSGTSMSTPHVAGLVAITREYYKKVKNHAKPSSALIKATLINGAKDLPDQSLGLQYSIQNNISCNGYPNMCEGWGLVNIKDSLYPRGKSEYLWFSDSEVIRKTGDIKLFELNFSKGKPIKITLVWTDLPPEVLQNDLDLKVVSPSGKEYLGNTFTKDGKKSMVNPKAKNPQLNNNVVERIIISEAEKDIYKLYVEGKKIISSEGQTFAIVASERMK